jgi:hypothetical protein
MATRKVTSKKTGNGSRRTTTLSSTNGKTESYSNKPTKQSPRRTVSFNHKTGKIRTTYSQKLGGGYTRINSKTTGGNKPYKVTKTNTGSVSGTLLLLILLCCTIMYLWPITIPYIIGTVASIVAIVVIFNLIIIVLPWVLLGVILYGFVYLIGVFV